MDPYGDNTAKENEGPAQPPVPVVPEPPAPDVVPDPVRDEQVVYTRAIQTTAWAGLAKWVSGMTIPTGVIMAYIQRLGYTTTAQVDANTDSGTVTIVTTGSVLPEATWAAFAGGSGATAVEVTKAWSAFAESTTTAVPGRDTLIALWFHLERNGIGPLTIFRRWDGTAYWIVLTTYGSIPAGVAEAFVYRAPDDDDVVRLRVFARNNPPQPGEQFYIALQAGNVLEVETGIELTGLETVRDIVPITTETAQTPAQVQEIRTPDLIVTPGFFEQVETPVNPREGDIWLNGTIYKQRTQGAWVDIAETRKTNQGSVGIGRFVVPVRASTVLIGWGASAAGSNASAIGTGASAAGSNASAIGTGASAAGYGASAFGSFAKADPYSSLALGRWAEVPASSPSGIALGYAAKVPENTPNYGVIKVNQVELVRSSGLGATNLVLHSTDSTTAEIGVTNNDALTVNGAVMSNTVLLINEGQPANVTPGSQSNPISLSFDPFAFGVQRNAGGEVYIQPDFGHGAGRIAEGDKPIEAREDNVRLGDVWAIDAGSGILGVIGSDGRFNINAAFGTGQYEVPRGNSVYTKAEIDARVSNPTVENDQAIVATGTLPTTGVRTLGTMTLGPLVNGVTYDISAWMLVKAYHATAGATVGLDVGIRIHTGSDQYERYDVTQNARTTCIAKWRFGNLTGTGAWINVVALCKHATGTVQSIMSSGFITAQAIPRS